MEYGQSGLTGKDAQSLVTLGSGFEPVIAPTRRGHLTALNVMALEPSTNYVGQSSVQVRYENKLI